MARYLVTSALPYINGIKHLGNLVGSMLPADVHARFLRKRGHETLFICATDEHGTPAELAALKAGLDVAEYCRQQHALQEQVCRKFDLSFDYFGRSSSPQNRELTQHFAEKLEQNGLIREQSVKQLYSLADRRFLPDRYVIGVCPHCGYEWARGDQCESCTRVLDSTELIDPRSAISDSRELETRESRHLYLLQSALADELRAWIEGHSEWPVIVSSIALKWLNEGLRDRCITRDLSWGVPVDRPGFEGKVFYVWFDAPIEYIGATREWAGQDSANRDWKSWWYQADDVHYVQFLAKDNVPFHTVGFPATLIGAREPWKLVDYIKGFNWLTYYGGKFSTSAQRGVFMDQALELLPADYWRYHLIANAPETGDADFTWEHFATTVNSDLADKFGNFVNRTVKFLSGRFGLEVPAGGDFTAEEHSLAQELTGRVSRYTSRLEAMQYRNAVHELRAIWSAGNNYLSRAAPWTTIKSDRARTAGILRTAINLIRIYAVLAWPIVPATSAKLFEHLNLNASESAWIGDDLVRELGVLSAGRPLTLPGVLFRKIAPEQIEEWTQRFGGAESA